MSGRVKIYLLQVEFLSWYIHDTLLADDVILFFDEDFNKVTLFANHLGILGVNFDNINLDDNNHFDEDDPKFIIHVRLLAWRSKFEKRKASKKDTSK